MDIYKFFAIRDFDMYGGDISSKTANNYYHAVELAKEWIGNDPSKCATYFQKNSKVCLKYSNKCNPSVSPNHAFCISFFYGKSE